MKIQEVLQRLKANKVDIGSDTTEPDGTRIIIVGCPRPAFPYGRNRFAYSTIVLSPGQDDVALEEREAIRRRLGHLTTDFFGDDEKEWPDLFSHEEDKEE